MNTTPGPLERIPLVDLALEIELGSRTYLDSQSALYQLHIRARRKRADRQDLSGGCCRWQCLSERAGGRSDQTYVPHIVEGISA
jgi:hypothetical protein